MTEFNIEKISVSDAKVIIAAIDYYSREMVSKRKNKILKSKKEAYLIEELKKLKEMIEHSEMDSGINIKKCIAMNEEKKYKELINAGKPKEEVQGMFMYLDLFEEVV